MAGRVEICQVDFPYSVDAGLGPDEPEKAWLGWGATEKHRR
jgi:hypothetical protein